MHVILHECESQKRKYTIMQKLRNYISRCTPRTRLFIAYFLVMGIGNSIFTRFAAGVHNVFLLPAMLILAAFAIRDEGLKRDVPMLLGCAGITWAILAGLLNGRFFSTGGAIGYLSLMACWFFTLRLPRDTTAAQIDDEFTAIGLVYMACYLPFILVALYSLFSGKLIQTPFDAKGLGLSIEGFLKDRLRVLENQNICGRVMMMNILFSIYMLIRRKKRGIRIFSVIVLIINLIGITHVQSRGSTISLAIAIGVLAFRCVYLWVHKRGVRVVAGFAACAAAFFLVIGFTNVLLDADIAIARKTAVVIDEELMQQDTYAKQNGQFDVESTGRVLIWKTTLKYLKTHPKQLLLGLNSTATMPEIAMGEEYVTEMKHVHNVLLDCIVQLGLPYLLIVLAFLAYMVPKCWRVITQKCRDGSCVFVALLVGLLTDGMVEIMLFSRWEGYNTLFMLMCGYILHICKSMDREKKEISSNPETCGNQTGTADV